jgi:hypothetical protein
MATLFPSWNDPEGEWTIEGDDLTTGQRATARVTMKKGFPQGPQAEPGPEFRLASPELVMRCPPLDLPGFANFVPLKATLRSAAERPLKVRVTLDLPDAVVRLGGERTRELILRPGVSAELTWDIFVSREEALAMYYSAKPSGFRVGPGPEVHKYVDVAYPALSVEVLDNTPVRFEEAPEADWQSGNAFRSVVPLHLMPLESRPPRVGASGAEPADLVVCNRLDQEARFT